MANVIENIMATCDGLGDMKLCGIKLEDASRDLLNVMDGFLDQHVAMQPAAMAYYLTLKKTAKRRLDNAHAAHDRWEKKLYALSKAAVESGTTAKSAIKVEDVKARFIVDNEPEIEKWEARIGRAQEEYDTLDAWCEAWKQKSFSLREYISIEEDERFGGSDSIAENRKGGNARTDDDQRIDRVRQMIRKKRNQSTV